ncbi:MAG: pentapeptide repeat-containing protein [Anaerolineales bacterium]|nr:pentapeptide repeat-containing protein [Anaerolineales bacterium]
MRKRILVAYASGSGSTREVAEIIAEEIESTGLMAIVQPVAQVETVSRYSGVILGSSIRVGRWLPEAVACLERIKDELSDKPIAYFTTCLTMADDTKESRDTVLEYMQPILKLTPNVTPVGLGLFAGSLDPQRQAILTNGPYGDFRDWDAIRTWAQKVSAVFLALPQNETMKLGETVLSFTDLSYSNLSKVDLQGAKLQASYLVETNLEASNLEWTDLSGSQMHSANLFRANLIGSIMTGSVLKEANLAEAILNGAILQNANLSRANLMRADLNWVNLRQANLTEANLQYARLGWANLSGAILEGADFTDVRYNEHTIWPEAFSPEDAGCINMSSGA